MPTVELETVCHIGTLDPADKGRVYNHSWEGAGLSISVDPEEWQRIARLGGLPHHWLKAPSGGGRFVHRHELSDEQYEQIARWGVDGGFCERQDWWRVSWFDDEVDDEVGVLIEDHEQALEEAADMELEDGPERVETLVATAKLRERLGMDSAEDCFDHLLTVWVEDETDLDGVWWADEFGYLSAPRGVIVPSRVERWLGRGR